MGFRANSRVCVEHVKISMFVDRFLCRVHFAMMSSYADGSSLRPSPSSLRELQRKALLKLLNLNVQEETTAGGNELVQVNGEPVWKFLVFDKLGQDVISSVLRVSDLREAGVTVHMQLKADRHQMEDVPAGTSLSAHIC